MWYPSHVARAKKEIRQNLRLVDVVFEIVDARIPRSSRIAAMKQLLGQKQSVIALNKADLADPAVTSRWVQHFAELGHEATVVNAKTGQGVPELIARARTGSQRASTGQRRLRPYRAMAVGIPNVGKSSLLNRLAGRRSARTGERPGITRGRQWIRVAEDLELLDMPGILWPEHATDEATDLLCITGALPDETFDVEVVASRLLGRLGGTAPEALTERYGVLPGAPEEALTAIARQRGLLATGGVPDTKRAAQALLADFRSGRLGRVSLEEPDDELV
ncbi:MAG: ribosome biogenesis GTPase YlqF [Bacillota bacterium]|nr:ribosome biogenesis GTPase YlqF [Bacillota bacterium]